MASGMMMPGLAEAAPVIIHLEANIPKGGRVMETIPVTSAAVRKIDLPAKEQHIFDVLTASFFFNGTDCQEQ